MNNQPSILDQLRPLVIIIVVLAALLYFGGILWAGLASLTSTPPHAPQIPDFVTNIVTGIGALLATYFGAVLGISVPAKQNVKSSFSAWKLQTWAWDPSNQSIQIAACYAYFISLVLAALFWLIVTLRDATPADVLRNMSA